MNSTGVRDDRIWTERIVWRKIIPTIFMPRLCWAVCFLWHVWWSPRVGNGTWTCGLPGEEASVSLECLPPLSLLSLQWFPPGWDACFSPYAKSMKPATVENRALNGHPPAFPVGHDSLAPPCGASAVITFLLILQLCTATNCVAVGCVYPSCWTVSILWIFLTLLSVPSFSREPGHAHTRT